MRRTRVKICGLTRPQDAQAAVAAGADAVGVVLAPSKRRVSLEQAARVLAGVPPFVARVGVFVDADEAEVREATARLGLHAVQFHGAETPEVCRRAPAPVIKAVRVGERIDAAEVERFRGSVAAVLLDTLVPGAHGGTGEAFCWQAVSALPEWAPVVLAGGLTADNVAAAIAALAPYAVDVSSGVEEAPGLKDASKIHAFIAAVRAADEEGYRA